jgi:hypothetical protein
MDVFDTSNDFYDSGYTDHTMTTHGTAQMDTAQKKFGVTSGLFDGAGDYVSAADHADWSFGTGDFTIDFWVRFSALAHHQQFVSQSADGNNRWRVQWAQHTGKIYFDFTIGGVTKGDYVTTSSVGFVINTWYHVAIVRNGANAYCFVNGVSQALTVNTSFGTNDVGDVAAILTVGADVLSPGEEFSGWMDQFRIVKGTAVWTSNFTPSSSPYEGQTGQINFLNLDGDTAEVYKLVHTAVDAPSAGGIAYRLRFNVDYGNNYGYRSLYGNGASVVSGLNSAQTGIQVGYLLTTNDLCRVDTLIYAKSGYARTTLSLHGSGISGLTVDYTNNIVGVWDNTADNITIMNIFAYGGTFAKDSYFALYRKVE